MDLLPVRCLGASQLSQSCVAPAPNGFQICCWHMHSGLIIALSAQHRILTYGTTQDLQEKGFQAASTHPVEILLNGLRDVLKTDSASF